MPLFRTRLRVLRASGNGPRQSSPPRWVSNMPENEQVQFFHEEFLPLAKEEHALREQLPEVGQRSSSSPSTVQ